MTNNITKTARYKMEYTKMVKLLNERLANDDPCTDYLVWQRVIELGRDKHLPLDKAIEIAEQELNDR